MAWEGVPVDVTAGSVGGHEWGKDGEEVPGRVSPEQISTWSRVTKVRVSGSPGSVIRC